MPAPPARGEDGAALVLALVFTTVVGLMVTALLTLSFAQFRATEAHREQRAGWYALDAGLAQAVGGVRLGPPAVQDPDASPPLPAVLIAPCIDSPIVLADSNGYDVSATCELVSTNTVGDTLEIEAVAVSGDREVKGHATVGIRLDGGVEVTAWSTRAGSGSG